MKPHNIDNPITDILDRDGKEWLIIRTGLRYIAQCNDLTVSIPRDMDQDDNWHVCRLNETINELD